MLTQSVINSWGTGVLARLANYHPERFLCYCFVAVGYAPPGKLDTAHINKMTLSQLGYEIFGYMDFFNEEDSGPIIEEHVYIPFFYY